MAEGNFAFGLELGGADAHMMLCAGTPRDCVVDRNKELDGDVDVCLPKDRIEGGIPARLNRFPAITVFAGPAWVPVVQSSIEVEHEH